MHLKFVEMSLEKINGPTDTKELSTCLSLAVLGTMSDAGKSIITAGLCRILANHDISVAPFKAQNMSNNSTPALLPPPGGHRRNITPDPERNSSDNVALNALDEHTGYGEIGTAQALQAEACRIVPRVEMNPVLLKSGGRRASDGAYLCSVIVMGKQVACEDYGTLKSRTGTLRSLVLKAHEDLAHVTGAQAILIEGAGSCTELNLMERDIVNLPLVRELKCPWLLVANIDCGGVFAQIVGTKACLPPSDWDLCAGIIVNKLRGEVKYFEPGPKTIEEMVGKPVFVVPYLYHLHLPEEDGLGVERRLTNEFKWALQDRELQRQRHEEIICNVDFSSKPIIVVVVAYPHVSIADDLCPLESDSRFTVQWRRDTIPPPYPYISTVILPGSRLTRPDLKWLAQDTGWGEFLREHVKAGGNVLGLCGGYQMLGMTVQDAKGIEGGADPGISTGLQWLPIHTVIEPAECKVVRPREATLLVDVSTKQDIRVQGFELHCGQTTKIKSDDTRFADNASPLLIFENGEEEGLSSSCGRVKGTYLHGLLRSPDARKYLLVPQERMDDFEKNIAENAAVVINPLDRLATHLEDCGLDFDTVAEMIGLNAS